MILTVAQLAERLGAELVNAGNEGGRQITSVGSVKAASQNNVTFAAGDKHIAALGESRAGAAIVAKCINGFSGPQLIVKNVDAETADQSN